MKKAILFTLLIVAAFVSGCNGNKNIRQDKAAVLPVGFFLTDPNGKTSEKVIKTKTDGSFDQTEAENILKSDLRIAACTTSTDTADKEIQCFEMNNLSTVGIEPVLHQVTDATGRQFYGLESDFALNYLAQLGIRQQYKYMLEYQLIGKNPQYKIYYNVNPVDLMEYQAVFQSRNKRWVPLFAAGVFAPESLMLHELIDLQANVDFPVYFKAEGGMFKEVKTTLGHRFIIRQYANHSEIARLVTNKAVAIFEEATDKETKDVTYGDNIDPVKLVFEYKGKLYKVTNAYIQHLTAENVTFKNPKPAPVPSMLSVRTFEELSEGMVPISTSRFFE
jgi:hypothetical protein